MNWKSWPYWVKGGVIGLVIGFIAQSGGKSTFFLLAPYDFLVGWLHPSRGLALNPDAVFLNEFAWLVYAVLGIVIGFLCHFLTLHKLPSIKNWPYWMKGGAIGAITWIIVIISFFACLIRDTQWGLACLPFGWVAYPAKSLIDFLSGGVVQRPFGNLLPGVFLHVFSFLYFVLPTAVLGWFYGKFKNRKQLNSGSPPTRG